MALKRSRPSVKDSWKQASPTSTEDEACLDIPMGIREFPASAIDTENINRLVIDGVLQDHQTGDWIEALGITPHFDTFKELFVLKSNNNNVIGGAGFQLRNKSKYIEVPLRSTNKGWHTDWFYHGNHAPSLSEFAAEVPVPRPEWSAKASPNKKSQVDKILEKIANLKKKGYIRVHVAASFIYRRMQPIKKCHIPAWKFNMKKDPTMEVPEELIERELTLRLEGVFSSLLHWTPGSARMGYHSKITRNDALDVYSSNPPLPPAAPERALGSASSRSTTPENINPEEGNSETESKMPQDDAPSHLAKKSSDSRAPPPPSGTNDGHDAIKDSPMPDLNSPAMDSNPEASVPKDTGEPSLIFEKMTEPTYDYPIGPEPDEAVIPIHRVVREGVEEEPEFARVIYHIGKHAIAVFDEAHEQEELKIFEELTQKAFHLFQELASKNQREADSTTLIAKLKDRLKALESSSDAVDKLKKQNQELSERLQASEEVMKNFGKLKAGFKTMEESKDHWKKKSQEADEQLKAQRQKNSILKTELSKAEDISKKAVDELNKFRVSFKEVEKLKEDYKAKATTLEAEKAATEKCLKALQSDVEAVAQYIIPEEKPPKCRDLLVRLQEAPSRVSQHARHIAELASAQVLAIAKSHISSLDLDAVAEGFHEDLTDNQCETLITEAQKTATILTD
ncbi:hypothetical protein QOZ80_1BG0068990 [Eleusine coracana subsp. coracana]|nr:hypothetical protein QOZ80_1BG0068990 [Eleusine coracana subsp. coracana]